MIADLHVDSAQRRIRARFPTTEQTVGWQIYDPETNTFIAEGDWTTADGNAEVLVELPPERGRYHVYISGIDPERGWSYDRGKPFLLLEAAVTHARAELERSSFTTISQLRRRNTAAKWRKLFVLPWRTLQSNAGLIRSMVRRDILARYRGSFGDVLWTVLNPLLLMATYLFVFGVVLQTRFGADQSRTGFALYFLCGMLPWLAFAEAAGRAPHIIPEHRNFVKKLVFPVEILPVNLTVSALVTSAFATAIFLIALLAFRGSVPLTAIALPLILAPQVLFTLGACWFLAALGVYVRDLGQVMGFLLTLVFFLTPICYPESQLPPEAAAVLTKSPVYWLVRAYRAVFLEATLPPASLLVKLWAEGLTAFFFGHAWFYKLRKSFADVI